MADSNDGENGNETSPKSDGPIEVPEKGDPPSELLKDVGPEEQQVLGKYVRSQLTAHISGTMPNPIVEKIESGHITQILTNVYEASTSERRYTFAYVLLFLVTIVGLSLFFAIREQYDIVIGIVSLAAGFSGGYGLGRYKR